MIPKTQPTDRNRKKIKFDSKKSYKTDLLYMKLIADISKTGRNNKSLTARKIKLKKTLQTINNEIHFTKEPIIKLLHEDNEDFKNEYSLFNKKIHRKQTKEVFKDLVKLYQLKGYRIPNFSINDHNLFKINPLLEESSEKISNGLLEEQLSQKNKINKVNKIDEAQKIMNYLKKLGDILSEQMNLDPDEQKKLFKKYEVPKLNIKGDDENDIILLKKQIVKINNLINTDALGKLDEKPKRRGSILKNDSFKNMILYTNKKTAKENNRLIKRRTSKPKISFYSKQKNNVVNCYNNNINDFLAKKQKSNVSEVSNNSNKSSNNNLLLNKKTSSNALLPKFFQNYCQKKNINSHFGENNNSSSKNSYKLNTDTKKSSSRSIISALAEVNQKNNEPSIFNIFNNLKGKCKEKPLLNNKKNKTRINLNTITIPSIPKHKTGLVFNKMQNSNVRLFKKIQVNENNNNDINGLNDDYLIFSSLKTNPQSLFLRTKNNNKNFPYDSEEEFVNYAYEKFNTEREYDGAEKMIKNYLQKVKKYNNEKTEEFINEIYDKKIFNNITELRNQIQENPIHAKTEQLYINNHMIKRIKPLLDNMDNKDNIIEKFDKSLINAISC